MKPTSMYKMSKQTKTSLALGHFKDKHARAQWKRAMIEAEIEAEIESKKKPKSDKD